MQFCRKKNVFTQPGSKADLTALKCRFRFTPDTGLNPDMAGALAPAGV
jgi:hypothetical protein